MLNSCWRKQVFYKPFTMLDNSVVIILDTSDNNVRLEAAKIVDHAIAIC